MRVSSFLFVSVPQCGRVGIVVSSSGDALRMLFFQIIFQSRCAYTLSKVGYTVDSTGITGTNEEFAGQFASSSLCGHTSSMLVEKAL